MQGQSAYRLSVNWCLTPFAQRQGHRGNGTKGLSAYRLSVSKGLTAREQRCRQQGSNGLPTVRKPGLPTVRQRALDLLKIWIRVAFVLRTVGLPRSRQRVLDSPDAASMSAKHRYRQQGPYGLPIVRKPGSCCQTPYGKRIDRLTDCP